MKPVPKPIAAVFAYSVVVHVLVVGTFLQPASRAGLHHSEVDFLWIFLALSFSLVWIETFSRNLRRTRIAFIAHLLVYTALQRFLWGQPALDFLLGSVLVIPIGLYERYPTNARITIGYILVSSFARGRASGLVAPVLHESAPVLFGIPLALVAVALAMSFMSDYRERLISTQIGLNRLDRSIGQLTRINQEYQDSLLRIEAEAAERERNRISRDIHDVVGYTLTNNIMLMEAATDMARINPLGVTRLLNTARENAQEGLQRIRGTLYTLRAHRSSPLHGISAIAKLIETFRTATGITVHASFGNVPIQLPSHVDSTVYHLIQESMVNSFRHGQASRIDVILSVTNDVLEIHVADDGNGTDQLTAGIGLTGMHERVSRLGGTVTWDSSEHGFRIHAAIPWEKTTDE